MRIFVALAVALAVLTATVMPWHRCDPLGDAGGESVVLAGRHAHDAHGHHGCGHEQPSDPGDRCCVDAPSDPYSVPAAGVVLAVRPDTEGFVLVSRQVGGSRREPTEWKAPVPRVPTETVVLRR
jgi:hypothetical protein